MKKQDVLQKIEKLRTELFNLATDPKQAIDVRNMGYWISIGAAGAMSVVEELDEPRITGEQAKNNIVETYPGSPQRLRNNLDKAVFGKVSKSQKLVVPKFLDEYMKENEGEHAADIFSGEWLYEEPSVLEEKVAEWLLNDGTEENNRRYLIAVQAFVTGDYEVEKEPLYEVVFLEDENDRYLLMELNEHYCEITTESENDGYRKQYFTEKEIKTINKRYWAFAVPVEEVSEKHEI